MCALRCYLSPTSTPELHRSQPQLCFSLIPRLATRQRAGPPSVVHRQSMQGRSKFAIDQMQGPQTACVGILQSCACEQKTQGPSRPAGCIAGRPGREAGQHEPAAPDDAIAATLMLPAVALLQPDAPHVARRLLLTQPGFALPLLGNASLAYVVNLTNFQVMHYTSALTLQV